MKKKVLYTEFLVLIIEYAIKNLKKEKLLKIEIQ
jgi:hypothetical protein